MLMPLRNVKTMESDAAVVGLRRKAKVPVGYGLLGRTLNGLGQPIDGLGMLPPSPWIPLNLEAPDPLTRPTIDEPFVTGQRAIDSVLTLGKGQRVGLFAGSGVGKSTILGEIAKKSSAAINVVALIGERGREVKPFVEEALGEEGLGRSVVVVATGEEPPLVRIRAAEAAISMASWFRDQGHDVLFMLDSLTRLAIAQRELGLLLGEPPSASGYPPSALQIIPNLMEPLGRNHRGSITGILTVLVNGDDVNEPVADTARGVLDGHIFLDRKLAEANQYPAINLAQSLSRLIDDIVEPAHVEYANRIRNILATYDEVADLIKIGMYQQGTSPRIDAAIYLRDNLLKFLSQRPGEYSSFEETQKGMIDVANLWQY